VNELAILEQQFAPLAERFGRVLNVPGVSVTAEQLVQSVMVSVERTPALLQCSRQSLFNSAMTAACLGLPCDGVTGQAYILPFKTQAQLVIGYRGYTTLAARCGMTITGEVVRVDDEFDFDEGEGWVRHKKRLDADIAHRPIIAVWAKAASKDRPAIVKVLSIADVLAVKARSPNGRKAPWSDPLIGFPAMAEKTAKRRLARNLPFNVMTLAATIDEAVEERRARAWITPDRGLEIEPGPLETPVEDAEAPDAPDAPQEPAISDLLGPFRKQLHDAARQGTAALREVWHSIPNEHQPALKSDLDGTYKALAARVDAEDGIVPDDPVQTEPAAT
jgi:recombination protein RecT